MTGDRVLHEEVLYLTMTPPVHYQTRGHLFLSRTTDRGHVLVQTPFPCCSLAATACYGNQWSLAVVGADHLYLEGDVELLPGCRYLSKEVR